MPKHRKGVRPKYHTYNDLKFGSHTLGFSGDGPASESSCLFFELAALHKLHAGMWVVQSRVWVDPPVSKNPISSKPQQLH